MMHYPAGRGVDRNVYPDWEMFFADLAAIYRQQIAGPGGARLHLSATRRYQPRLPQRSRAPRRAGRWRRDPASALHQTVQRRGRRTPADMAICTHLCRGNYKSGWMAEGSYEHVAEALFSELRCRRLFPRI